MVTISLAYSLNKMKYVKLIIVALLLINSAWAQTDTTQKSSAKIVVVPYPSMMYFSDADADLARYSRIDEPKLRNQLRLKLEANITHQLMAKFDVVSLISATSLNGEQDLKHIYAASQYYLADRKNAGKYSSKLFGKKSKKQTLYVTDSTTMNADLGDPKLFQTIQQKYSNNYVLYITQFEISTSNKNTIEWMKQEYKRTYILHYNLFDVNGKLILAETLNLEAGSENTLTEINDKYFTELGAKLREILASRIN